METPEEKAKRLGVPLISLHKSPEIKVESETDKKTREFLTKTLSDYMNEVVYVCACGKEITRDIHITKMKCGSQSCPFGYETN